MGDEILKTAESWIWNGTEVPAGGQGAPLVAEYGDSSPAFADRNTAQATTYFSGLIDQLTRARDGLPNK